MSLQVRGNHDADIYIQKGKRFPTKFDFYLASTEFKSDEIFIPTQRGIQSNETVVYTIGILGITDTCEYSLTAIHNSFQVYEPEFTKLYTSTITRQSPLVMRQHWNINFVKIFFYSADSKIEIKEGIEGTEGIIPSVKKLADKPSSKVYTEIGQAYRFVPTSSSEVVQNSKFFAIYPLEEETASLSIVVSHPRIPIKVGPSDPAVRAVLNRDEFILIEPFVDLGELNEFTITIAGISGHTAVTYNSK